MKIEGHSLNKEKTNYSFYFDKTFLEMYTSISDSETAAPEGAAVQT